MKLLIARLNHETNTFSPVPTPLAAFAPSYDEQAYRDSLGMRTAMAAFIDAGRAHGCTLVTPVCATANPSGRVHAAAYDALTARILAAAPGCDAVLLDLHGAMVAEHTDDGEGDLLARLRALLPGVPIGVALDLHGNITQRMVDNADIMVGFKTYPHVDMYETGAHVARLLFAQVQGGTRHTVVWQRLPLMSHTLRSTTLGGAMQAAVQAAQAAEARGVPAVSVFAGFALADIAAPCVSVVATAPLAGRAAVETEVRALADTLWQARQQFVYRSPPLAQSLTEAQALAATADKPVLLLDHSDNCMSGGTCDAMDVLQGALAAGLQRVAVGPLCDPEAVQQLSAAGVGATVSLELGNKLPLQALGLHKTPMRVQGKVLALSDGSYTVRGPIYTGQRCSMGATALLDIGAAHIVVTQTPHEPWDLGVFDCVGLDPTHYRYLLLKSRMYCRPVFVPLSAGLVECDSPGVTSSDYQLFPFSKVERPVFPLDAL